MPRHIQVKSVLNKTRRRDDWFLDDYTINLYSGCSFNCLYCYIRGSKYGINMADALSIKDNAIAILQKQLSLRAKKKEYGFIVLSSATDPYLQFEKEEQLTRRALEVILQHRFPVHIITKSDLVTRDFDLLQEINEKAILPGDLSGKLSGTIISFSFSTIEDAIAKIFEPGAPLPSVRLHALMAAADAGFLCGVSMMPLLPYITDNGDQLEEMFAAFKAAKAHYVLPATLTLFGNTPGDSKQMMLRAIEKHYPHLLDKYLSFFANKNEMPAYYRNAFYEKMIALSNKHAIRNKIII